jgi:hypothetical protein
MNATFQDLVGCEGCTVWYIGDGVEVKANWSAPYIDLITLLPGLTVGVPCFSSTGAKIGAMFADVTLMSMQPLYDAVSIPVERAAYAVVSNATIISMPAASMEVLFPGIEHPDFNLAHTWPQVAEIGNR